MAKIFVAWILFLICAFHPTLKNKSGFWCHPCISSFQILWKYVVLKATKQNFFCLRIFKKVIFFKLRLFKNYSRYQCLVFGIGKPRASSFQCIFWIASKLSCAAYRLPVYLRYVNATGGHKGLIATTCIRWIFRPKGRKNMLKH